MPLIKRFGYVSYLNAAAARGYLSAFFLEMLLNCCDLR